MMRVLKIVLLWVMFASVAQAQELRFGRYFSDNMVLQRDKPTVIRGFAPAGSDVNVSFAGQKKTAKADDAGHWAITLDPMPANAKGAELTATSSVGKLKSAIDNVLIGDVILFARQTSADISLGRDDAGKAMAKKQKADPNFRAISIRTVPAPSAEADLNEKATAGWGIVDRDQALAMSAAAYYMGRDLAQKADVPVGIVDVNMGWFFPVAWVSRSTFEQLDGVSFATHSLMMHESREKGEDVYPKGLGHYRGVPVEYPLFPSAGYNAVLHPLRGLGLKGVLLQLGSNYPYVFYEQLKREGKQTDRAALNYVYKITYELRKYGFRMEPNIVPHVTGEWRRIFGAADLPIAYVVPPSSDLAVYAGHNREMRELQRKVSDKEAATDIVLPGMDNIPFSGQPKDEVLLGERSLKWVMGRLYDRADVTSTGPVYDRFEGEDNSGVIHYKPGTAKGLSAGKGSLDHFEVADVDGEYLAAEAVLDGETIRLSCDGLQRIFYARYNWAERPDEGLVNAEGLPAIPFRTQDAGYKWMHRNSETDLPPEYTTPANKWEGGDTLLFNGGMASIGYQNFSGRFGPLGIKGAPFGPNIGVRHVDEGSPAYGKLLVDDYIYSVNGKMLGDNEEMTMVEAITEAEATDGKLVLGVRRGSELLDVELQLEVLGRYSATSPWNCLKTEKIVSNLEKYLAAHGAPSGFLNYDQLFMLGAGSPEYQWMVRANMGSRLSKNKKGNVTWALGTETILLSEYFLSTGDKRVLPAIQALVDQIVEMQIKTDSQRNGGWYGKGSYDRGYPAMVHAGLSCILGMTLARECGVDVPAEAYARGLAYLDRKGARVGNILYGDAFRSKPSKMDPDAMFGGRLGTSNGKVAKAAVLYELIGDRPAAHTCSVISTFSWYSTRGGHGGNFWNDVWTPLGAVVQSKEAYTYFMKNHRWYRECHRMFNGSLLAQDRFGGAAGLAFVVPRRRLRVLGGPRSPFSPNPPVKLLPALFAYDARDYKQAESLAHALLDDITLDKNDAPTVSKLAKEAKRMQQSIASDLARITELTRAGQLYEAGLMLKALEPVIAPDDSGFAEIRELMKSAKARDNDEGLYKAALKAGEIEDEIDLSDVENSTDLKKKMDKLAAAQAQKPKGVSEQDINEKGGDSDADDDDESEEASVEAPAEDVSYVWECFSPRLLIPDKTRGRFPKPFMVEDESKAAKWRFQVLEDLSKAPEGWMKPGFDDSGWDLTTMPISWQINHAAVFRTTFKVKDREAFDALRFTSWVFRQQNMSIYLNGVPIARVNNIRGKTGVINAALKQGALDALKNGENTLALYTCHDWRWGMGRTRVYNSGLDFMLSGRTREEVNSDQ